MVSGHGDQVVLEKSSKRFRGSYFKGFEAMRETSSLAMTSSSGLVKSDDTSKGSFLYRSPLVMRMSQSSGAAMV